MVPGTVPVTVTGVSIVVMLLVALVMVVYLELLVVVRLDGSVMEVLVLGVARLDAVALVIEEELAPAMTRVGFPTCPTADDVAVAKTDAAEETTPIAPPTGLMTEENPFVIETATPVVEEMTPAAKAIALVT